MEECALREVKEETGIRDLVLRHFLCVTYHLYIEQTICFKETYWYSMRSSQKRLYPQREEGISKAIWVKRFKWAPQLKKTYESVIDVINSYYDLKGL
jgi:hypothetical protein